MFNQLFFIFLALILINFISAEELNFWVEDPLKAINWAIAGGFSFLALLFLQSKIVPKIAKKFSTVLWQSIINIEILLFLSVYHYGLGAQRFFQQGIFASVQTPYALVSLFLYFFALGWEQMWTYHFQMKQSFKLAFTNTVKQLSFFSPFCLPFILLSLLIDSTNTFFHSHEVFSDNLTLLLSVLPFLLIALIIIFLPFCLQICWRCHSLQTWDFYARLESVCSSLNFRHAGLKIWTSMSQSFTAGIIGIIPAFRYILFSPGLLNRFKIEEIEAILVHEIGHHRYRHLLLYPWIMLGMIVTGALFLLGLEKGLSNTIETLSNKFTSFPLVIFLFGSYAVIIGLYFRLIFGFFSRLFERQADLFIFESSLSPFFMIQSLDRLGVLTGYSHSQPSWHHFSIQQRINFLTKAIENPSIIKNHHDKVKKWLLVYFFALVLSCIALYYLF